MITDPDFTVTTGTLILRYQDFSDLSQPAGIPVEKSVSFIRGRYQIYFEGVFTINGAITLKGFTLSLNNGSAGTTTVQYNTHISTGKRVVLFANTKTSVDNFEEEHAFDFTVSSNNVFESTPLGGDGLIQKSGSGYTYNYFLKDHLGSTRMVLDENGTIKQAMMYQPYGTISNVVEMGATSTDPLREKFTGKEYDEDGAIEGVTDGMKLQYFGRRYYDSEIGFWTSTDPVEQFWSHYSYAGNGFNPITSIDSDGRQIAGGLEWVAGGILFGSGVAALLSFDSDKEFDWRALILPGNTDRPHKNEPETILTTEDIESTLENIPAVIDRTQIITPIDQGITHGKEQILEPEKLPLFMRSEGDGLAAKSKTHQTYTKKNAKTGETYTGKTSGTGTPEQNIANRDRSHHMNDKGYGPAQLDKSSPNENAIRGREQQVIDSHGGAKSEGGTSGNAIRGVSRTNKKADIYREAAEREFGN